MAVITPQLVPHVVTGLTASIGAGISVPCRIVTPFPAREVGKVPAAAKTGCVRVLPTPAANTVMICPGATLSEVGEMYPAPTIVLGLAVWPNARSAVTAAVSTYLVAR